jgi:S-DNA-T family DNA segregation ATPase FtsK/SpoIIIE
MVGASREMVSRVMKDLEDRGFIETRDDGSMLVKDRLCLSRWPDGAVVRQPRNGGVRFVRRRIFWVGCRAKLALAHDVLAQHPHIPAPPRTGNPRMRARFAHEITRWCSAARPVFWLLALLSYTPRTPPSRPRAAAPCATGAAASAPGWPMAATSCSGYSVWWCLAAGVRAWLSSLARWMRGGEPPGRTPARASTAAASPSGSAWPCCCAPAPMLEWSRLYRSNRACRTTPAARWATWSARRASSGWASPARPGRRAAGGAGAALVFRFSWSHVAERIGPAHRFAVRVAPRKARDREDLALGQQAAREARGDALPTPAKAASPPSASRSRSTTPSRRCRSSRNGRRAQERARRQGAPEAAVQGMPDSKLPQVDLLDGAQVRQETVSPDTLEMTSR